MSSLDKLIEEENEHKKQHVQVANWLNCLRRIRYVVEDSTMTDSAKIGHIRNMLNLEY